MSRTRTEPQLERQVVVKRVTVGLIKKVVEELDRLQQRTGMSSTDLVNRAISLAAFVDEQNAAGKELLVRDPKTGETMRVHMI